MSNSEEKSKRKSSSVKFQDKICNLCENPSQQVKILLFQLKNRLALKIKHSTEQYGEINQRSYTNPLKAFSSLLQIVIGQKNYNFYSSKHCRHEKIFKYFRKKMKCSQKIFKQSTQHLSIELGSRNYHFELLNQIMPEINCHIENGLSSRQRLQNLERRQKKRGFKRIIPRVDMKGQKKTMKQVNEERVDERGQMVRESELEQGVIKVKIEGEQERKDVENRNGQSNNKMPYMYNYTYLYPFYETSQKP